MAEIIKIVDLDIDEKDLLKKLTKLQEEIKSLKTETKALETANKQLDSEGKKNTQQYKDNSAQIEKNKVKTKGLSTEYRNNQNTLVALNSTETKQLGTLQKLDLSNKKLREEAKRLDLTQKDGQKRLVQINKQLDQNNKTILKNADATKAQKMNIGNYSSALQGVGGPLARTITGIKAMTKAALAFIATPIGIVIAAIGIALAALTSFFKRSEEGQDAFRKGAKVLGSILDNLLDVIDSIGEKLYNAFTKPEEALENFKKRIKSIGEFFKNTFGNIIGGSIDVFVGSLGKGFKSVGLAWQKFKGIFVDNAEGILKAQENIEESNKKVEAGQEKVRKGVEYLGEAYDKVKGKIRSFRDEIIADAAMAKKLADEEAALRKLERRDLVENAKLNKESARLRGEAELLKFTNAKKSIDLLNQSFDLDEKVLASEMKIAERKAENARIAATLARSDIETLDEIARLEADIENKQKSYEELRRQRTRRLNMVRKEAFVQEKMRLDTELKLAELNAAEIMRINERIIEDKLSTDEEILDAARQNTALKLELLAQESDLEFMELKSRLDLALISQEDFEQQKLLIKQNFANESTILLEKNLDFEKDLAVKSLSVSEKKADDEKKLAKEVARAKFEVAGNVGAAIEALFGEHTIAAKFAAIAQALINTYLGATAAFAQTPGGIIIKSIAAGAATAIGLANVAKIRRTQKGSSGSGGGGISMPSVSGMSSFPPRRAAADGGITTQGITDSTVAAVKQGMKEALSEKPDILVIEEVTRKQIQQDSVSQVTTV